MHPRCPQFGGSSIARCRDPGEATGVSETFGQRPFRGSIAVARGRVTKAELYGKAWRRILHDVYIDAAIPPTQRLRIQAASLRYPDGGIVTGRSAAFMWGATLGTLGDPVEMLTPKRSQSTADIRIRSGSIDPAEVVQRDGVRLPTPLHTAWELARSCRCWTRFRGSMHSRGVFPSTSDLLCHAAEHTGEWRSSNAPQTLRAVRCAGRIGSGVGRAGEPCAARCRAGPHAAVRRAVQRRVRRPRRPRRGKSFSSALEYDGQRYADPNRLARDRGAAAPPERGRLVRHPRHPQRSAGPGPAGSGDSGLIDLRRRDSSLR